MLERHRCLLFFFFFFQAEDGIRDLTVTGVQTCALPIWIRQGANLSWTPLCGCWSLLFARRQDTVAGPPTRRPYDRAGRLHLLFSAHHLQIGRASCRERV